MIVLTSGVGTYRLTRHSVVRRVSLAESRRLSVRQSLSMRNSRRYSAAMSLTDDEFLQLLERAADNMARTSVGVGDAALAHLGPWQPGPIHTSSCASLVMYAVQKVPWR